MRPRTAPSPRLAAGAGLLCVLLLALGAEPCAARILKTRGTTRAGGPLQLVVGSGFEYETDGEESEYGFPFLTEYGLTDWLKVSAEPSYIWIRKRAGGNITGPGDLETTLTFEFPTERRYRPGLGLETTIKWPTATRGDLGTGERDVSIGGIVSKEIVRFDLEANAVYTFIGSPPGVHLQDTFEGSVASEYSLTRNLDLELEFVTALGTGGRFRGGAGSLGGFANIGGPEQGQSESEATLGMAEHLNDFLKLEQGAVFKFDGSWQFVFAWEWDFSGER